MVFFEVDVPEKTGLQPVISFYVDCRSVAGRSEQAVGERVALGTESVVVKPKSVTSMRSPSSTRRA